MGLINAEDYFDLVVKGFAGKNVEEAEDMTVFSEEIFKIQWVNRLRFNSYVALADRLDEDIMRNYANRCYYLAKKRRNLMGEPVVCNAVAISEDVSQGAIDLALGKPSIHMTIDAYPVVVDLRRMETYYYTGPIPLRILFNRFERDYIDGHFALPLRILKDKQTPL